MLLLAILAFLALPALVAGVVPWLALIAGHPWNYVYAVLLSVIFHLRVVLYEEEQMERLLGGEWNTYRQAVPRSGVTLRPYTESTKVLSEPSGFGG